jgi:hypothetical protein
MNRTTIDATRLKCRPGFAGLPCIFPRPAASESNAARVRDAMLLRGKPLKIPYPCASSGIYRHFDHACGGRCLSADAKALRITTPQPILLHADRVIE